MERIHFEKKIQAPVRKVYETMVGKDTFHQWTRVFDPSAQVLAAEENTYMEKGAKMLFAGVGKDNKRCGMVSYVRKNDPEKFVSFEHVGILDGDQERFDGPEVEQWKGFENYTFQGDGQQTTVAVDVDVNKDMEAYFKRTFPKALDKLEEICIR